MKNLLRTLSIAAALVLVTACAGTKPATTTGTGMVCVMSGEALDANSPSSDYKGQKVGFCCDKCQAKWTAMDDAGKQAKLAAMKK
jgi:hypothetical protein